MLYKNAIKTSPKKIIKEIWNDIIKIYGENKLKKQQILKTDKINKYFQKKFDKKKYFIIVVDELDYLLTRDQKEIYEIFNWSQYENSFTAVIGISNTINLPQKLLPKISSRINITHQITFSPYNEKQIFQILNDRIYYYSIFETNALEFCSKKIANSWGDIRFFFKN
jgi:Cdc6-like AAA superfamily ATPase